MKMSTVLSWGVALVLLTVWYSCVPTQSATYLEELSTSPKKNSTDRLDQIANLWTGHFTNQQYIQSGKAAVNIEQEFIGRRIWRTERVGEYWLFLGWYPAGLYANPLSANIAQITRIAPDTAFITFYGIDRARLNANPYEWAAERPYTDLRPDDLIHCGDGCGSYIVRDNKSNYQLVAGKAPCYEDLSDVVKAYYINASVRSDRVVFNSYLLDHKNDTAVYYQDNTFQRLNRRALEKYYTDMRLEERLAVGTR